MKESEFDEKVKVIYQENKPDWDNPLVVAVLGKVSAGKSSLINAMFGRDRGSVIAEVGAASGVTRSVRKFKLDDDIFIYDSPGLDDIIKENSEVTESLIKSIDIAIFVVSGSADKSQRINYSGVKSQIENTFFVLNKIDEYDKLNPEALDDIEKQWMIAVGVEKIYKTCAYGYDPRSRDDMPLDIRGVDELMGDIFTLASKKRKDILLARHVREKRKYAISAAASAVAAASIAAFAPGSTAIITGIQIAAISGINYIYTGKKLSFSQASSVAIAILCQNIGKSLFIFTASFIPFGDAIGATIAALITAAALSAVIFMLEKGYSLDDSSKLAEAYKVIYNNLKNMNIKGEKDKSFYEQILDSVLNP